MGLDLLIAAVVLSALVVGGVAQLLAVYHILRFLAVQTPERNWRMSSLDTITLLRGSGLSEAASHHRKRFLRWEAVFIVCAALAFAWDAFLRQPNSAAQSDAEPHPILWTDEPNAHGRQKR